MTARADLLADLESSLKPNPARPRWVWWGLVAVKTVGLPRIRTLWCYRLGQALQRHGLAPLAWLLVRHAQKVAGAEIDPRAQLGPGIDLWHTAGIVIGHSVVAGQHLTLLHGVTLGAGPRPGMPVLGDHVFIGSGARVLGGVRVGDRARIGAGAVVVDDVPAGATVVGLKADIRTSTRPEGATHIVHGPSGSRACRCADPRHDGSIVPAEIATQRSRAVNLTEGARP